MRWRYANKIAAMLYLYIPRHKIFRPRDFTGNLVYEAKKGAHSLQELFRG